MNEHQIRIECLALALRHNPNNAIDKELIEFADRLYKFVTKKTPALPVSV